MSLMLGAGVPGSKAGLLGGDGEAGTGVLEGADDALHTVVRHFIELHRLY
jgi:hypothetical protein